MSNFMNYDFRYKNPTNDKVYLWVATPPETHKQKVQQKNKSRPAYEYNDKIGNQISYYIIEPKETVKASYGITLLGDFESETSSNKISDKERKYYLSPTSMVNMNEETQDIAMHLTKDINNAREQALAIFYYVVNNYKYKFPPKARGVKHFLKDKKGDCGEFSFMYASLCRSIGIPCRIMFGSLGNGKHRAHVWNEIYLENNWVTVDTSMANLKKKQPWKIIFPSIKTLYWKEYFGKTEKQRVIFSIGTDHIPFPSYPRARLNHNYKYESFKISGEAFIWGKSLINERIPYLQPMYLYYDDIKPLKVEKTDNILGLWRVQEHGSKKVTYLMKNISGYTALLLAFLYFVTNWDLFSIVHSLPAFLFFLSYVIRKERSKLFIFPTVAFGVVLTLVIIGGVTTLVSV